MRVENLTVVVPFWQGHATLGRLLDSLPAGLPVVVVDDHSDQALDVGDRQGVRVIRPGDKGFFAGAVNAGLTATTTDVVVVNQDAWFTSDGWLKRLARLRQRYAYFGDGVEGHPAFPAGYVQGTFMVMRRDAIERVGGLNAEMYPLWGCTAEWQLRAARCGFRVKPDRGWRQWMGHEGRHGEGGKPVHGRKPRYGSAIQEAMTRWPQWRRRFVSTPPAVSVIMPCYNYGRYIADAINSLVGGDTSLGYYEPPGQTLQSFEVWIVDDASTDDSWDAIREVVDPWKGIHAIRLAKNRGTPGAINAGITQARGEFVHILSADDMREPWGLAKLYDAVRDHPRRVAYGDITVFARGERVKGLVLANYDFELVLRKNPMPAGIMYARSAWQEVGGYPELMKYGREDWAMNIKLGLHGYCGHHVGGQCGNLYRREGQNRSLRTGNVHKGESGGGFSWRAKFQEQLRTLYPRAYAGERPPMCCGEPKQPKAGAQPRSARTPSAAAPDKTTARALVVDADPGMEWIEYIGGNHGNAHWWGPATGTKYVFGGGRKFGQVHAEDVPGMLNIRHHTRAVFRRWQPPKPAVSPLARNEAPLPDDDVPEAAALVANPPEADNLTDIHGIGNATASKLAAGGYTTFAALASSTAERVAQDTGVAPRLAEVAVAGAQEQVGADWRDRLGGG